MKPEHLLSLLLIVVLVQLLAILKSYTDTHMRDRNFVKVQRSPTIEKSEDNTIDDTDFVSKQIIDNSTFLIINDQHENKQAFSVNEMMSIDHMNHKNDTDLCSMFLAGTSPVQCDFDQQFSENYGKTKSCLKNKSIWLIGDSRTRQLQHAFHGAVEGYG